jgi:hypothetical protein
MSLQMASSPDSPYKFLDYYEFDDRDIFFGRETETEILLSDVISTRIVVLFARTGSGKTSLINAGVRPRLEDLDYATFYVRVEKDPEASLQRVLGNADALPAGALDLPLTEQLQRAVGHLGKPVVVFFDQFEEFFIYLTEPKDQAKAQRFIASVAALYRDRESGVHTVFSLREEYFVEMDVFRDEIPSIFHNDSSLRLRPLDNEQARRAIELPAKTASVRIEPILTDRLLADLPRGGRIEPVRLQIVCDSLWNERSEDSITLESYQRLGGAQSILDKRLVDDLRSLDDADLRLIERLLPELRTSQDTKYTRGFEELADRLGTDATSLGKLVGRLKALRLIRELTRNHAVYLEWTSDYLAERTNWLLRWVRAIGRKRLLASAFERVREFPLDDDGTAALQRLASEATESSVLPLSQDEFDRISDDPTLLDLQSGEVALLFASALARGTYMQLWFQEAERHGVAVWMILQELLAAPDPHDEAAINAVRLLGTLDVPRAAELISATLAHPRLADIAFNILGEMHNDAAIAVLATAAEDEATAAQAVGVLSRMGRKQAIDALTSVLHRGGAPALRAGLALSIISNRLRNPPIAQQAEAALTEALNQYGPQLFVTALQHGLEMQFWFDRARAHGANVWEILRTSITGSEVSTKQSENAVRFLGELPDNEAQQLLRQASEEDRVSPLAKRALSTRESRKQGPAQRGEYGSEQIRELPPLEQNPWSRLIDSIAELRVTPILGSGAESPATPRPEQIAQRWVSVYALPVPQYGGDDLAVASQALSIIQSSYVAKMSLAEEIRSTREERNLGSTGTDHWDWESYNVLADLPFTLYITTSYDDGLMRALQMKGKTPRRDFPRWNDLIDSTGWTKHDDENYQPSVDEPLVFQLFGVLEEPESLVLTEDDYLRFLTSVASRRILPVRVRGAMARTSQLLIGHQVRSWPFRTLWSILQTSIGSRFLDLSSHILTLDPQETFWDWRGQPREEVVRYLEAYFAVEKTSLYWGSADDFARELHQRWEASHRA